MKRRVRLRARAVSVVCMVPGLAQSDDEAHTIKEKGRSGQTVRCPNELPAADDDSSGHVASATSGGAGSSCCSRYAASRERSIRKPIIRKSTPNALIRNGA